MREEYMKLRVHPIYSIVIGYVVALLGIAFAFLPSIFSWEYQPIVLVVVFHVVCTWVFCWGIYDGTRHIQFVVLQKEKVVIKNLFTEMTSIKWNEIVSVKCEDVATYMQKGSSVSLKWIVLRTEENQQVPCRAKPQKKGNLPLMFISSKKNISAVLNFARKLPVDILLQKIPKEILKLDDVNR